MAKYLDLLKSWQCGEDIIKIFEGNAIDDESFVLLSDADIHEMIKVIGPRRKFLKKYHAYLESINDSTRECTSSFKIVDVQKILENQWITGTVSPENGNLILDKDGDFDNQDVLEDNRSSVEENNIKEPRDNSDNCLLSKRSKVSNDTDYNSNDKTAEPVGIAKTVVPEKISRPIAVRNSNISTKIIEKSLFPEGLKSYLATNYEGRLALKSGDNLDRVARKHLVRSVVEYLFKTVSHNKKIRKELFIQAAEEIVHAYPSEKSSVYFVLGKPQSNHCSKTPNAGKLWNRYHNVQKSLGGLFEVPEVDEDTENVPDCEVEPNEESTTAFQYLKTNVGTLNEQKENWRLCVSEREAYLRSHSIYEYMKLFPALRVQTGYNLLLLDFDRKYPTKKDCLYTVWKHPSHAILKVAIKAGDLSETQLEDVDDAVVAKYLP